MGYTTRGTYWGPCTQYNIKSFGDQMAVAEQRGWKVDGQLEKCPTTGREHYQFYVKTPQVRESEVRKVFQGAHTELSRNKKAVENYCHKEKTREGELPVLSDKYPNQDKLLDMFVHWVKNVDPACRSWRYDVEGHIKPISGQTWLIKFDEYINYAIRQGYRVESLAVNPAIRAIVKNYMESIFQRHLKEQSERRCLEIDRELDRQTDSQSEIMSHLSLNAREDEDYQTEDSEETSGETSEGDEDSEADQVEGRY